MEKGRVVGEEAGKKWGKGLRGERTRKNIKEWGQRSNTQSTFRNECLSKPVV